MNAETVELLTKYGEHNPGCDPESRHNSEDCNCGFNAVRKQIMATYTATPQPATASDAPEAGADDCPVCGVKFDSFVLHERGRCGACGAEAIDLLKRLRAELATVTADAKMHKGLNKVNHSARIEAEEAEERLRTYLAAEREAHERTRQAHAEMLGRRIDALADEERRTDGLAQLLRRALPDTAKIHGSLYFDIIKALKGHDARRAEKGA